MYSLYFWLFQTTKIQNFETNSQPISLLNKILSNCFRPQRYKILKPIHNILQQNLTTLMTVSDHKDTKFWNQFTTFLLAIWQNMILFQTTKIQNFETNSQHIFVPPLFLVTVSDHKDTKFWNQFTTLLLFSFS